MVLITKSQLGETSSVVHSHHHVTTFVSKSIFCVQFRVNNILLVLLHLIIHLTHDVAIVDNSNQFILYFFILLSLDT